jgi:phosphoenolpyruvate carboxylase
LRLTEQGEVLAERYDDARIATRHLEQLAWSALLSGAEQQHEVEAEWIEVMKQLARRSRIAYRDLVDHEGFVDFFRLVTPISEIEQLPIGSRPSRRQGGRSLKDLRAIPWVFSWTQVRCLIPAWFGVGTAVSDLIEQSPETLDQLRRMYLEWPFVQAWVDNAALAMANTDLEVFKHYAELANDSGNLEVIAQQITSEFAATLESIRAITEREELLGDVQWLAESIRVRNRYVDPLNLIQVELLRRSQSLADDDSLVDEIGHLIKLSIKGVATGMRTTG